jgi:hypothetical protein
LLPTERVLGGDVSVAVGPSSVSKYHATRPSVRHPSVNFGGIGARKHPIALAFSLCLSSQIRRTTRGERAMRLGANGWVIAEEGVSDGRMRPLLTVTTEGEAQDLASQLRRRGLRIHVIAAREGTDELGDRL